MCVPSRFTPSMDPCSPAAHSTVWVRKASARSTWTTAAYPRPHKPSWPCTAAAHLRSSIPNWWVKCAFGKNDLKHLIWSSMEGCVVTPCLIILWFVVLPLKANCSLGFEVIKCFACLFTHNTAWKLSCMEDSKIIFPAWLCVNKARPVQENQSVKHFRPNRWRGRVKARSLPENRLQLLCYCSSWNCFLSLLRRRSSWRSRRGRTTLQSMGRECACTALRRRRSWSSRGSLRVWEESSGCSFLVSKCSARAQHTLSIQYCKWFSHMLYVMRPHPAHCVLTLDQNTTWYIFYAGVIYPQTSCW